ncbi:MAG TPA: 16S rRNA (guanine(966)-N(2))-methyltransferase RsmD [Steroidobacteraceae bacterium]|jgi:16S rRNA (guanine966-N2)-methyltransferase
MRPERTLRIIAGQWRGRKFRFPPGDIRPTPDRVRETLFNWLQPFIDGARCLDLFAGSGALGLEALSRGAAATVFVEQQREAATAIENLLAEWQAVGGQVLCTQAQRYLSAAEPRAFDVVFLDPPFGAGALAAAAAALESGWLAPGVRIYIEHARRETLPPLPALWHELRAGNAGEVGYHLFERGVARA